MKLSEQKKELLRAFVSYKCEQCNMAELDQGKLQIHRIKRGGEYSLRNVKVLCKNCHKLYHSNEFKNIRSK
jgi:hypothetical protein